MKSVCCSGTMSSRVCVPWKSPSPSDAARPDRRLGLVQVVLGVPLGALLVLRLEERGEPALLVLSPSIPEFSTTPTPMMPTTRQGDDVADLRPADEQHAHHHGHEHQGGPEVGLEHDQRHRHAGDGEHGDETRASSSLLKWAITEASVMITTIFASSDGCSWNGPSWNHAWLPFFSLPEPRHHHQEQQQDAAVGERRQLAVPAVVEERRTAMIDGADAHEERLLSRKLVSKSRRVAAPGGAEDHQAPEGADGGDAGHQHEVDVAPRRRPGCATCARARRGPPGCGTRTWWRWPSVAHVPAVGRQAPRIARAARPRVRAGAGAGSASTSKRRRATGAATEPP